ncbi:DUF4291 domain-containing protein [Streptomyces sp. NPDC056149]|uniref:DUF4291 domain-containing protein n=1 Tax=Streptomyces sp. NPDC056149 TaxID=3345728 RepID=UPI0035D9B19F
MKVSGSRLVRAQYTAETITVYQANPPQIALPEVAAGKFVAPFKRDRMTWIKPSFRWMMYRSGWATKPGQERVLVIQISRAGFECALRHACLSHFEPGLHDSESAWRSLKETSPVRVQWDPERTTDLSPLADRAIQVGLSGEAVDRYVDQWIVELRDITPLVHTIHEDMRAGRHDRADTAIPAEVHYPLPADIRSRLGSSEGEQENRPQRDV